MGIEESYDLIRRICEASRTSFNEHKVIQQALCIISNELFKSKNPEVDEEIEEETDGE
jgi:hypothetical protein